ncbi:hypothetical protein BT69DRAFT_1255395 [Atractiella rhizophila]|nr:hypothetical protein BT69DRAFT_1255395 [Atractiella rhizophila]
MHFALTHLTRACNSTSRQIASLRSIHASSATFERSGSTGGTSWPAWKKKEGNVMDELERRGLVKDVTSSALRQHVSSPRTLYLGFDPTASSLHIGHLITLSTLRHFYEYGHRCILLIGGGTGQVGDPTGRREERVSLKTSEVEENVRRLDAQVRNLLGISGEDSNGVEMKNNVEWLGGMGLLEFLREVGKERMSRMLARDSVKTRLSTGGLSFTEFTYQLLQAYDFLHLHRAHSCTLQLGGSDQYGNIMSGVELIMDAGGEAYGLTTPLLTDSKGEKWGKSKGKAVWLDKRRTSPMELYQFFRRTGDDDVGRMLKMFSTIELTELEEVLTNNRGQADMRLQEMLACNVTQQIHGESGLAQAQLASQLRSAKSNSLSPLLQQHRHSLDTFASDGLEFREFSKSQFVGASLASLLCSTDRVGFWESRTQMLKELGGGKSLSINGSKVEDVRSAAFDEGMLLDGSTSVFVCGQKIRFVRLR